MIYVIKGFLINLIEALIEDLGNFFLLYAVRVKYILCSIAELSLWFVKALPRYSKWLTGFSIWLSNMVFMESSVPLEYRILLFWILA